MLIFVTVTNLNYTQCTENLDGTNNFGERYYSCQHCRHTCQSVDTQKYKTKPSPKEVNELRTSKTHDRSKFASSKQLLSLFPLHYRKSELANDYKHPLTTTRGGSLSGVDHIPACFQLLITQAESPHTAGRKRTVHRTRINKKRFARPTSPPPAKNKEKNKGGGVYAYQGVGCCRTDSYCMCDRATCLRGCGGP